VGVGKMAACAGVPSVANIEKKAGGAVPRPCSGAVRGGRNGYRNVVASCSECNSQKGEQRAEDYLRWLCREGRSSTGELSARFRALARLAAGKLGPALTSQRDGEKRWQARPQQVG
jgi:hypothetical protein